MKTPEARQFWIFKGSSNFCNEMVMNDDLEFEKQEPCGFYDIVSTRDTVKDGIHVIEHSALQELSAQVVELRSVLEFYSYSTSYMATIESYGETIGASNNEKLGDVWISILNDGGKRARAILAKYPMGGQT